MMSIRPWKGDSYEDDLNQLTVRCCAENIRRYYIALTKLEETLEELF